MALALMAGVLVGLIVAATNYQRAHSSRASQAAADAAAAAAAEMGRLEAELSRVKEERNTAQTEARRLRDEVNKAAKESAAVPMCTDRHTPWTPSAERDKTYPELAEFLKKVGAGCWVPECWCWVLGAGRSQELDWRLGFGCDAR